MRYLSAILLALLISTSLIVKPITFNSKIDIESRSANEFSKIGNNGVYNIEAKFSKESIVEMKTESN